jgi:hypothetical protein
MVAVNASRDHSSVGHRGCFHKTFMPLAFTYAAQTHYHTYERLPRRLLYARLYPCGQPELPMSRGPGRVASSDNPALEEESDTKCPNQRVP